MPLLLFLSILSNEGTRIEWGRLESGIDGEV
jgi:hypothetical protein